MTRPFSHSHFVVWSLVSIFIATVKLTSVYFAFWFSTLLFHPQTFSWYSFSPYHLYIIGLVQYWLFLCYWIFLSFMGWWSVLPSCFCSLLLLFFLICLCVCCI
jgi:hypothetical protein